MQQAMDSPPVPRGAQAGRGRWRAKRSLGGASTLLAVLLPLPLDGQEVEFEVGRINFGPVVTEEVESFVRFGQHGGWASYFAVGLANDRWYTTLRLAPTQLHRWSTADTVDARGRSSDPTESRWSYRPQGHTDDFLWGEFTAGYRTTLGPAEARVGGGVAQPSQTRHSFWGAHVGPKPMAEASISVGWSYAHARCRISGVHVGEPFGRWSVLEHAARDVGDSSVRRTIVPVSCGLGVGGF